MHRRRKRISIGTVAMVVFTAIVLVCTFAVVVFIRGGDSDLSMDAERLVSSIGELVALTQPDRAADEVVNMNVVVAGPPSSSPVPIEATPFIQTTASVAQSVATPVPQETAAPIRRTLSMTIGGLISFEGKVIAGTLDRESGKYILSETLDGISSAVHAHMNIALLNSLPNPAKDAYHTPLVYAEALKNAGFDYVLLGADKTLEAGEKGVAEALEAFASSGIAATGLYAPESQTHAAQYRVNGLDVTVLVYTDILSSASKSAVREEAKRAQLIEVFDQKKAVSDVKTAKDAGTDIVLVSLHWGASSASAPTTAQRAAAQALCNAGADIIIGAHSDAVQHVEYLNASNDPAHQTLVAWSMGTLLSESRANREVVSGILLHLDMAYDEAAGRVIFEQVSYTPTYTWGQKDENASLYKYRVLISDEEAPAAMVQTQKDIMGRALRLIQNTMSKGVAVQR